MRQALGSLLGLLLLAGCAGTASPTTTAPAPSASAPATSAAPTPSGTASASTTTAPASTSRTIHVTLAGGTTAPHGERVELARGTTLILRITADHTDEVHVHGYDIEIPVGSGAPVTRQIVLDEVGRFEVESHEPALTILQLVVS